MKFHAEEVEQMKILLAPDSFKGSLTAMEAANAMKEGILEVDSNIETILLPVADGGEGTMQSLIDATNGELTRVLVEDPLGKNVQAAYGVLGDGETCVIEIAEASGLTRLNKEALNPIKASSYGTGELIQHALNAGYRKFIIGLGGSATNDGGAGLLQALGIRLLNDEGADLKKGGGALADVASIDMNGWDARIADSEFIIAGDVKNPFVGPNGASVIFGPQKGASAEEVVLLDSSLKRFADVFEREIGIALHEKEGAGAAGGAGGAFLAFFDGQMRQGIQVVLEAVDFAHHVSEADLVLTGEGKTDLQTLSGKAPVGIAQAAKKAGKPTILISGTIDEDCRYSLTPYFTEIYSVVEESVSTEKAVDAAFVFLKEKTKEVMARFVYKEKGK